MPDDSPFQRVEAAAVLASNALQQIQDLAPDLTAEQCAEAIQWLGLQPGPTHRLAGALTALGTQLATERGGPPEVWDSVLESATRISSAGLRAALPAGEALDGTGRHRAAAASSPAMRAAGPGAVAHSAPPARAPHARIVEPPRR